MRIGQGGKPVVGWKTIGARYKAAFKENPDAFEGEVERSNVNLKVDGDAAWVVYEQHTEVTSGDETDSWDSLEVRFLVRIDGEWKIVFQSTGPLGSDDEM